MPRFGSAISAMALMAAACSGTADPTAGHVTVAFVMVGPSDDLGYNQAVSEGSIEVARRFPDLEILRVENVPETEEAERVMRDLVDNKGADLVFATSYGHLAAAYAVAADHPGVTFVHQGGIEPEPRLHNLGTYFGSHWQAMYEAGIAAGHATATGRMGFIAAFPIPATFANVGAFTLGAQTVRPEITTEVVYTEDWCNPDLQREMVARLLQAKVDVLALHQDCTGAILEAAEQAKIAGVVGYHADGSEVAATRWLAGAVWQWGPLYSAIVQTVLDGGFDQSPYTGDYRGSMADGNNPFTLTDPGPSVSAVTRAAMADARAQLTEGFNPFTGPMSDNTGTPRLKVGEALRLLDVDSLDWFVAGVDAP